MKWKPFAIVLASCFALLAFVSALSERKAAAVSGAVQVQGATASGEIARANPVPTACLRTTDAGRYMANPCGASGAPQVEVAGAASVVPSAVIISTARLGDCTTPAGDGGTVSLIANARYRCTARGSDVCLNSGAAITSCSLSTVMAPNGMFVKEGSTEEMSFGASYAYDAGVKNGTAEIFLSTPSGVGCFSCNLLTPIFPDGGAI